MIKFIKKNYIYLLLFLFWFTIATFTPISGDDWHNYVVGQLNLRHILGQTIGMYFTWEGRLISRLLINLLTYHKFIFNFLLAFLLTLSLYLINNNKKITHKKLYFLLTFSMYLSLENKIFTQTILWVAGSITYLFPTILTILFLYLYFFFFSKKKSISKISILLFNLLAFSLTLFVENIAFAFVLLNIILLLISFFHTKKLDKLLLSTTSLSLIGSLIMLLSPGSNKRLLYENAAFSKMSFFSKIATNYSNFIYYTISSNLFLQILLTTIGIILTLKFLPKKPLKIFFILFLSLYPLINSYYLLYQKIPTNNYANLYWTLYLIYLFFLTFYYLKKSPKPFYILVLPALSANLVMLITPSYSSRTTLFTTIFLSLYCFYLLNNLLSHSFQNLLYKILLLPTIFLALIFVIASFNLYRFAKFQKQIINQEKDSNCVTIYEIPSYLAWGLTPHGTYHVKTFKEYYHLKEETTFNYQNSVWDYYIFFNQSKTKSISHQQS